MIYKSKTQGRCGEEREEKKGHPSDEKSEFDQLSNDFLDWDPRERKVYMES